MDLSSNTLRLGKRPALVLVDMINGFTDPACDLGTSCPEVVAANKRLLTAFRDEGLPIFFTTVVHRDENVATVFREKLPALNCLQPGSHWIEVDSELAPLADEPVVEKQWASAFFGTNLAELLKEQRADSLVVTGLTTSGCVRASALDGLQHNYPVWIPREAVGDRNPQAHEANLFDLNAKYCEVVGIDDVLAHLSERS